MKKQTLEERLELYVTEKESKDVSSNILLLAASAVTGVGAVLVPPPAEAAIVYSGIQELDVENSASTFVDFDGDEVAEFTFFHSSSAPSNNYQIMLGAGAVLSFIGNSNKPTNLTKGLLIDDNGMVATSTAVLAAKKETASSGNFLGDSGYLGVKFEINTVTYFGWIQYESNNDASVGTIIDWAYEDIPGKGIKTGDRNSFNWTLFIPAIISGARDK